MTQVANTHVWDEKGAEVVKATTYYSYILYIVNISQKISSIHIHNNQATKVFYAAPLLPSAPIPIYKYMCQCVCYKVE